MCYNNQFFTWIPLRDINTLCSMLYFLLLFDIKCYINITCWLLNIHFDFQSFFNFCKYLSLSKWCCLFVSSRNYLWHILHEWSKHFFWIHLLEPKLCCIAWSKQQEALISIWILIKQSSFISFNEKMAQFSHKMQVSEWRYVNIGINEPWTAINMLSTIPKSV